MAAFGDHVAGLIEWIKQLHAGEVQFTTGVSSFWGSFAGATSVDKALDALGDSFLGLAAGSGGGSGTFLIDDGDSLGSGTSFTFDDGDST